MNSDKNLISGYDLAKAVLNHPMGGIDELLTLSGNGESHWLELKASVQLSKEDERKGESQGDLYWNIAKAIIGIANCSGGILIIGIDDKKHSVVPLEENDCRRTIEKEGLEGYHRKEILEKVWPDNKTWKTSKGEWKIKDCVQEGLIEVLGAKYQGREIAVILIKPARDCIYVWKGDSEKVLTRDLGEVGKTREIVGSKQMRAYEDSRRICDNGYAEQLQKFLRTAEEHSEEFQINSKIDEYYRVLEAKVKKTNLFNLAQFTSLDAEGVVNEGDDDFSSPEAEEMPEGSFEDDSWLSADDDNEEEDDDDSEDGGFEDDSEDTNDDSESDEMEETKTHRLRSGDLLGLMRDIPRMIVLGEPGGGKTTSLVKFAFQFREEKVMSVFIRMGQWGKGGTIGSLIEKETGLSSGQREKLISESRLRVLIDAVNECSDEYRKAAIRDIEDFLKRYPTLPVVISSRTNNGLEGIKLSRFFVHKMDEKRQLEFLNKYLNDTERAQSLFEGIQKIPGGAEIASNPMLLRLVIEVFKDKGELPSGRANLYHRWLRQWYKREAQKAKCAGEPFLWNFGGALEILSDFALKSRLRGHYHDVPLDVAEKVLQTHGSRCIEKLCQGPVITIDGEFVRFRHETFQEYLCAEQLIQHPDYLSLTGENSADNEAQWGMVLAYCVELRWPLPEPLWRAAWAINPWFGAAVTDRQRAENPDCSKFIQRYLQNLQSTKREILFRKKAQYFAYAVSVREEVEYNWGLFELWHLSACYAFDDFVNLVSNALLLRVDDTAKNVRMPPQQRIKIPERLNCSGVPDEVRLEYDSFCRRDITCTLGVDVDPAMTAVRLGLADKTHFSNKLPGWIGHSSPQIARDLIDVGFAVKEDFSDRILGWIGYSSIQIAKDLIDIGIADKEDFPTSSWIKKATLSDAKELLELGFAVKEDFSDKIPGWIEAVKGKDFSLLPNPAIYCTLGSVKVLLELGFAVKEDFSDKIPGWIEAVKGKDLSLLSNYAICRIIGSVKVLLELGFAVKEDFSDKISSWIEVVRRKSLRDSLLVVAKELFCLGFAKREDLSPWLIRKATSLERAKKLLELGFAAKEDFSDKISLWIRDVTHLRNGAPRKQISEFRLRLLLESGLVQRADLAGVLGQQKRASRWAIIPSQDNLDLNAGVASFASTEGQTERVLESNPGSTQTEQKQYCVADSQNEITKVSSSQTAENINLSPKANMPRIGFSAPLSDLRGVAEGLKEALARNTEEGLSVSTPDLIFLDDIASSSHEYAVGDDGEDLPKEIPQHGIGDVLNDVEGDECFSDFPESDETQEPEASLIMGEYPRKVHLPALPPPVPPIPLPAVINRGGEKLTKKLFGESNPAARVVSEPKVENASCLCREKVAHSSAAASNNGSHNPFEPDSKEVKRAVSAICLISENLGLYRTLQKMEFASREQFSAVVPFGWDISFEFLDSHRGVFKKLVALCQSLDKNNSDEKSVAKKWELINLLSVHKELAWVQRKLLFTSSETLSRNNVSFAFTEGQSGQALGSGSENTQTERKQYCVADLQDGGTRQEIQSILATREFDAKLLSGSGAFAFFESEEFAENLYCNGRFLPDPCPRVGDICSVKVEVIHHRKDERYVFNITKVAPSQATKIPDSGDAGVVSVTKDVSSDVCVNSANLELYKTLQKMEFASREKFSEVVPSGWDISFEFLDSHRDVFKKLVALCQALRGMKCTDTKRTKKKRELTDLLYRKKEFSWLREKLISESSDSLSTSILTGHRIEHARHDGITAFSADATQIRIYIDENWPGCQEKELSNFGVIAGIVWKDGAPDFDVLPHIKTHRRGEPLLMALRKLQKCSRAFPFIFPIFKEGLQQKDYSELLRIALITLLGWILPHKGPVCDVKIYCEGIVGTDFPQGRDLAPQFQEICHALKLTQGRLDRWNISTFISTIPEDKDFEYLPYADAVAYTMSPVEGAHDARDLLSPQKLAGYLPLSLDLLRLLCDLDTYSADGHADALLKLASKCFGTKFFDSAVRETINKAKEKMDFRNALFAKLEACFEEKERNLKLLSGITRCVVKEFPIEVFDNLPKQKLVRILVELQSANHDGDPRRAEQCVKSYLSSRERLLKRDFQLCAYADMNLAVHYNDRFEFEKSAAISRRWENEPAFEVLSNENKGRILSSIGQSYALRRDCANADKYFVRAIDLFEDPDDPLPAQVDQTRVYQALNVLESQNWEAATVHAEQVFACSFSEAIEKYAPTADKAFHHHLLVKNLFRNPTLAGLRKQYLQYSSVWKKQTQHPWELIELYRVLLLNAENKQLRAERFKALLALYDSMPCEGILLLLRVFANIVYRVECAGEIDSEDNEKILNRLEVEYPAMSDTSRMLKLVMRGDTSPDSLWHILPFNYQ